MTKIVYEVIEHDGGWAFRLDGTISETFRSHDAAYAAAKRVAIEQMRPGKPSASPGKIPKAAGTTKSRPATIAPKSISATTPSRHAPR